MSDDDPLAGTTLICDPNEHMGGVIAGMARSLGLRDIVEVHDTAAIRSALAQRRFRLVLINDLMGDDDSTVLLHDLRADIDNPNRNVPVIMMSSAPDVKRIAAARDAGVNEFLRKPFAANHLQSRLTSIETNPRAFIEAGVYNGPDRRRRTVEFSGEDRRGRSQD